MWTTDFESLIMTCLQQFLYSRLINQTTLQWYNHNDNCEYIKIHVIFMYLYDNRHCKGRYIFWIVTVSLITIRRGLDRWKIVLYIVIYNIIKFTFLVVQKPKIWFLILKLETQEKQMPFWRIPKKAIFSDFMYQSI